MLLCSFGRGSLRALLIFRFISLHLAHEEQTISKIKFFLSEVRFSWTVLVGGEGFMPCSVSQYLHVWTKIFPLASILNVRLWGSNDCLLQNNSFCPHLSSSWHLPVETLWPCGSCLAFWEKVTLPLKNHPLSTWHGGCFFSKWKWWCWYLKRNTQLSYFSHWQKWKGTFLCTLNARASFLLWNMRGIVHCYCAVRYS